MDTTVDACGLSCPQPAILADKAISAGNFPINILVDTVTARENVRRTAEKQGCGVKVTETEDGVFKLVLTR